MEVAGKTDYGMHFNLQSFMKTIQTLDLEHRKVKLGKSNSESKKSSESQTQKGKRNLRRSHESCGNRKKRRTTYTSYVRTSCKLNENEL